jgi:fructoselysine-6-P-deglycase FrlB-like protein
MTDTRPGAITLAEIATQPQMWRRAQQQAADGSGLPADGTPVLFLGCGTSYYIGSVYAYLRTVLGRGRTRACVPSEVPYVDPDETIVVLSRSGTTTDVIEAARRLRADHPVIGLIGTPGTGLAGLCNRVVDLSYADEVSIVQTRFATTALTVLRASLPARNDALVADAEQALARPLPDPLPRHVVFLGTGASLGIAHEAALKCLEASGQWAEAYAMLEYQHGPISAAGPGTLVWPLVPAPAALIERVLSTGARIATPTLDPQAELVVAHRLAVELALAIGRDPDVPPHLSRSVI